MKVLDLSVYQGVVDGDAIARDFDGVIMRLTSGASYVDPTFATNYAKLHGKVAIGAYHVLMPIYSAQANFTNFQKEVEKYELGLGCFMDIEVTNGVTGSALATRVRDALALFNSFRPTKIYTAKWFWSYYIGGASFQLHYKVWLAGYPYLTDAQKEAADFDAIPPSYIPPNWQDEDVVGWQFTSTYPRASRYVQSKGLDCSVFWLGAVEPPPDNGGDMITTWQVIASNGLNVRNKPTTCGTIVKTFPSGYVFEATQVIDVSATEQWAKVGDGLFCATRYNGTQLAKAS